MLRWLRILISTVKTFIQGAYHGLPVKYLNSYLDEFASASSATLKRRGFYFCLCDFYFSGLSKLFAYKRYINVAIIICNIQSLCASFFGTGKIAFTLLAFGENGEIIIEKFHRNELRKNQLNKKLQKTQICGFLQLFIRCFHSGCAGRYRVQTLLL